MSLQGFQKTVLISLLFLSGCKAVPPSEVISTSVIKDLKHHTEAIELLEKQTTVECKTDSFVANLNAIKAQTESIAGQVKSINESCKVEKEVLAQQITVREIIICVLLGLLAGLLFLFIRKRV